MANQERIKTRLDNIRSVEPILGAMRTISLGSWQAALTRQARLSRYSQRLIALLPPLIPHLAVRKGRRRQKGKPGAARSLRRQSSPAPTTVLIIGSERGLCGAFNSGLVQYAVQVLAQYETDGVEIELATLGSRARRTLQRSGWTIVWSKPLPMTTLPTNELAYELTREWLERYEAYELDAVDLIYNAYRGSTLHEPRVARLIPPPLPPLATAAMPWPAPYIDTDRVALYTRLIKLWVATEMYRVLLDSAAAEHSARFQLMEGATQNSNDLIAELTLALQAVRQQAITSEMQELASGAGLVGEQQE